MSKRAFEEIEDTVDDSEYLQIKAVKFNKTPLRCVFTNIISNNRKKLNDLFTGEKWYEIIPFHTYMSCQELTNILESYKSVLDAYDAIKDEDTFAEFEKIYTQCKDTIVDALPTEGTPLEMENISIPLPYGLFYAAVTQVREAFNTGKITFKSYASIRDYATKSPSNKLSLVQPYVQYMMLDDIVSPSDVRYNELDVKYLDVFPTFVTVYRWLTPKVVYMHNAGINLNVDRYKMYIKMHELIDPGKYPVEDMMTLVE